MTLEDGTMAADGPRTSSGTPRPGAGSGSRTVRAVVEGLVTDETYGPCVVAHRVAPAEPARYSPLPPDLDERLVPALAERGVQQLYTHQRRAYDLITGTPGDGGPTETSPEGQPPASRHTVIVTPTASGKTLCYNLPVLQALLKNDGARALYLFPTKALSRDQAAELQALMEAATRSDGADEDGAAKGAPRESIFGAAVYDGDTPPAERRVVRDRAHVVLSNPDMLHAAILPHHARWMRLFENLEYVVIDELHNYRGVFGSHLGNVLRRLRRVCRFHGSDPVFIAASATIANAKAFAERLLELPVEVVEENGAPLGERHFVMINPPIANLSLGLRASYLGVARRVASRFLEDRVHTIVFCGSRTVTEVMTKYLKDLFRPKVDRVPRVVGYRGGYLPIERRSIERGLRDGSILGVVSTNALELGIDIGSLDACVIAGYPGTVASTRQQAGRAGRRQGASAAVLVLRSHPLDQHLADHPEFLLEASPESAQINPDNLQILVNHLRCAAFELPIEDAEAEDPAVFGGREDIPGLLAWLEEHGVVRHTGGRWHWSADSYPATDLSLRSVTSTNFVVVDTTGNRNEVIAEVDYTWAFTTIHEGAIYMIQSEQFHVDKLDWDRRKAFVRRVESEYYTDAQSYAKVKILQVLRSAHEGEGKDDPTDPTDPTHAGPEHAGVGHTARAEYGEVEVVRKAIGYKKIKFYTQENLGWGDILLPEDIYHTQATWFTLPQSVILALGVPTRVPQSELIDALNGLANLLHGLASLLLMCDGRDMGVVIGDRTREWFLRPSIPGRTPPGEAPHTPPESFEPTIFLYDQYSGGIGLAEALHPLFPQLLAGARDRLLACQCEVGCPSCVGPELEVGTRAKGLALELLEMMLAHGGRPSLSSASAGTASAGA